VTDRRAGRISTETNRGLVERLNDIRLEGVEVFVRTVKEHRAVLVLRGDRLDASIGDTDPQETGVPPRDPAPSKPAAKKTADRVRRFVEEARRVLQPHAPANGILLRGFDQPTDIPGFRDRYGLRAAALACYPMYRGLARLVGMDVLDTGESLDGQIEALHRSRADFDFFFVHYKPTDSRGEDGDFDAKVRVLETLDERLPDLLAPGFDVVVVTGDHSTPAVLKSHSWHPVPFLLHSRWCIGGTTAAFTERAAALGMEGRVPSVCLVPMALAHAGRLAKFGA